MLRFIPLSVRLAAVPVLLGASAAVSLMYITETLEKEAKDAVVINLAGRQRMLNQRLAKETLLGLPLEVREGTFGLLAATAKALEVGGDAPLGGGKTAKLPPARNATIAAKVAEQTALLSSLREAAGLDVEGDFEPDRAAYQALTVQFHTASNEAVTLFQKDAETKIAGMVQNATMLLGGSLLVGFLFSVFAIRGVTAPLRRAIAQLLELGDGRMGQRFDEEAPGELGKLGRGMNAFVERFSGSLAGVKSGAHDLDRGAGGIQSTSMALASASTEQAASLRGVATHITRVQGAAADAASGAAEAERLSTDAQRLVREGRDEMARMSEAMKSIQESSVEVAGFMKVIEEIAFQTNLLSLNASVEAARAGEVGAGFAVVADEVRNLAVRSAEAASESSRLTDMAVTRAQSGVELVQSVEKQLTKIDQHTQAVQSSLSQISSASAAQSTDLSTISVEVENLDQATQSNAATAEMLSGLSHDSYEQVRSLRSGVSWFHLDDVSAALPGEGANAEAGEPVFEDASFGEESETPIF